MFKNGGNPADLVPVPLPPEFQEWRVFYKGRPIDIVIVDSADAAIEFTAALYSVPPETLTALREDVARAREEEIEKEGRAGSLAACYHEAAHAVIAHHLGAEVVSLSTIPQMTHTGDSANDIDSLGRTALEYCDDHPSWIPGSAARSRNLAVVLLSGLTAEFRFVGRSQWRGRSWEGDVQRALQAARDLCAGDKKAATTLYESWRTQAGKLVEQLWSPIVRLAEVLVKERQLGQAELCQLLSGVPLDRGFDDAGSGCPSRADQSARGEVSTSQDSSGARRPVLVPRPPHGKPREL